MINELRSQHNRQQGPVRLEPCSDAINQFCSVLSASELKIPAYQDPPEPPQDTQSLSQSSNSASDAIHQSSQTSAGSSISSRSHASVLQSLQLASACTSIQQPQQMKQKPRTCSACHQPGHIKTNKICPGGTPNTIFSSSSSFVKFTSLSAVTPEVIEKKPKKPIKK